MDALWITLYWLVSGAALLQALLIALQTWEHRRFLRSRLTRLERCPRKGRALLIVPCRGAEPGLEQNLRTMLRQDYGNYQVRFVVESVQDPAWPVICRLLAEHPQVKAECRVAGIASTSGQKVHNLLTATDDIPYDIHYLAFADSDARLRPQWLRALVSNLEEPCVAAATGYRWHVSARPSLAACLLHSVNASVAVFLGKNSPTVVWGGSWAIRRTMFEEMRLRQAWKGKIDEDLVAGEQFRNAGHHVEYEPACMVASDGETSLGNLFAFARRQYQLVRFYSRPAWRVILLSSLLTNVGFWGNAIAAAVLFALGSSPANGPAMMTAALYLAHILAGLIRQDVAVRYFPHRRRRLRAARLFEVFAGPLAALFNLTLVVASGFGHTVRWRGIAYRLDDAGMIESIERPTSADLPTVIHVRLSVPNVPFGSGLEPLPAGKSDSSDR